MSYDELVKFMQWMTEQSLGGFFAKQEEDGQGNTWLDVGGSICERDVERFNKEP